MLFEWVFYRFLHLCCYSVWINAIVLVLCHLVDWRLFSWCLLLLSNCLAVCLLCYFLCCLVGVCYFLCCVAKYAGWMCASSLCCYLLVVWLDVLLLLASTFEMNMNKTTNSKVWPLNSIIYSSGVLCSQFRKRK